mmetsp:Transcript_13529/g.49223  ORF Transcript_13529/g.49223 Transcript_13529/m.49223 type:complete len:485 (+) Transcript_13529:94-1548(+)
MLRRAQDSLRVLARSQGQRLCQPLWPKQWHSSPISEGARQPQTKLPSIPSPQVGRTRTSATSPSVHTTYSLLRASSVQKITFHYSKRQVKHLNTSSIPLPSVVDAVGVRAFSARTPTLTLKEWLSVIDKLSKGRLSWLVAATAAGGFVMGSGEAVEWRGLACTTFGTYLASAAANTINQVMEVANDSRMKRTRGRPLPQGLVSRQTALLWALFAGVSGVGLLHAATNDLAAGLAAGNLFLYTMVYTPLKVRTIGNTWLGAVVGAIPPVLGWAAASGNLDLGAGVLSAALYFWQLPHFMSLAWLCREDYAAGGYRMLTVLDKTGHRTAWVCLRNSLALIPLGALSVSLGLTSELFGYEAAILGGGMSLVSLAFLRNCGSEKAARTLFRASLIYLPVLMVAMAIHRCPQTPYAAGSELVQAKAMAALPSAMTKREQTLRGRSLHDSTGIDRDIPYSAAMPYVLAAPFPFMPLPILPPMRSNGSRTQ